MKRILGVAGCFLSLVLAAGCGDDGGGGPPAPRAYYVDAIAGDDATGDGSQGSPWKAITHAVDRAAAGDTINVAPGTYDTTNGETFPITLKADMTLAGDVANKGDGATATLVQGRADAGAGDGFLATIVAANGVVVSGLKFSETYEIKHYSVYARNASTEVHDSTVAGTTFGGVFVTGSGSSVVQDNDFTNIGTGVRITDCPDGVTVDGNVFPNVVQAIVVQGATTVGTISANTVTGSGNVGIRVEGGTPLIQGNTFNRQTGYERGAIHCQFTGSPVLRTNTFQCDFALFVEQTANPDLGTDAAADAGANDFSGVTGVSILHDGSATVYALGNTWPSDPPVELVDIIVEGTGTVIYGAGGGDQFACPYDYWVDDGAADNSGVGSRVEPWKTITYALTTAASGATIKVMPGVYDVAGNGETFPLSMDTDQRLIGDILNKGDGATATYVDGDGDVGSGYMAAVDCADGVSLRGFAMDPEPGVLHFSVFANGVSATVSRCTFTGYGGVALGGNGDVTVSGNVCWNTGYSVRLFTGGTGIKTISGNYCEDDINIIDLTDGDVRVLSNTIVGGSVGVMVEHGSPLIESNTFSKPAGYTQAAVKCSFDSTPTVRGNVFDCNNAVLVGSTSTPDLGTDEGADAGGNDFSACTGVTVTHTGSETVYAIGNAWPHRLPVPELDLSVTGTGEVIWGMDAADSLTAPLYYVDAIAGDDVMGDGSQGSPWETVTFAAANAGALATVKIMPGTYDAANGETFPIQVQAGQKLVGDVANKGDGATDTRIVGQGNAGGGTYATLEVGDNATLAGIMIGGGAFTVSHYALLADSMRVRAQYCTFEADTYAGVRLADAGWSLVENCVFDTDTYGVYVTNCPAAPEILNSTFLSMPIPINVQIASDTVIRGNTITGSGQVGIQLQANCSGVVEANTFDRATGYTYGALRFAGSSPTVRRNVFLCQSAVSITGTGNPDLGTDEGANAGENDFSAVTGVSITHEGTATVNAIGNTWPNDPPVSGTDISVTDTGSVVYGTGTGDHIP